MKRDEDVRRLSITRPEPFERLEHPSLAQASSMPGSTGIGGTWLNSLPSTPAKAIEERPVSTSLSRALIDVKKPQGLVPATPCSNRSTTSKVFVVE